MFSNIFYFDAEKKKKVPQMFGRTEEEAREDGQIVEEWARTQPHFPETMDRVKINNFLIQNKFSIEKTKQKIDMYFTIKSAISDFFEGSNPALPEMQELFNKMYLCVHPKPIDGLYRAFFVKAKERDQLDPLQVARHFFNTQELRLHEDCIVGDEFFFDLKNLTLSDLTKVTPTFLVKSLTVYGVFSMRMKAVHLLNSPPYVSMIVSILKGILKPKLFQRVQVHQDDEILEKIFTKEDLPKDYGGDGPSLQELTDLLKEKYVQYRERFDKLDELRVDESLRPAKLNNDEILGFHGNFKKLNVD